MGRTVLGSGDASPARWKRAGSSPVATGETPFENCSAIFNYFFVPKAVRTPRTAQKIPFFRPFLLLFCARYATLCLP